MAPSRPTLLYFSTLAFSPDTTHSCLQDTTQYTLYTQKALTKAKGPLLLSRCVEIYVKKMFLQEFGNQLGISSMAYRNKLMMIHQKLSLVCSPMI